MMAGRRRKRSPFNNNVDDGAHMRFLHRWAAVVLAIALAGCTTPPQFLEQNTAVGVTPSPATRVLIVIDGKMFGDQLAFGSEGEAYLQGLAQGFQQALPEVQSQVVRVGDPMSFGNPVPRAIHALRPSHMIRLWTASVTRRGLVVSNTGMVAPTTSDMTPVSAVWEMDAVTVGIGDVPDRPGTIHVTTRMIYKARTEGDTCTDSDSMATHCGAEMGKFLADTLRAAHVMQFGSGA